MSDLKTEADFAANLNTVFRINADTPEPIELTLVEVIHRNTEANEEPGMERFSLMFTGPSRFLLEQQTIPLIHEVLGAIDLFLVPLGQEADGIRYEAVFNYYKPTADNSTEASA
jgi:hypothetical protein